MANNKMLIDASHPEETRVAVVRGNRVEEFDFEAQAKKQLRGNIYLAKVTRVEPSLQAAFVDYGGNRHGFLAFSEIHPDYYQIPVADRQALLEEEAREAAEDDDSEEARPRSSRSRRGGKRRGGSDSDRKARGKNSRGRSRASGRSALPDAEPVGPLADMLAAGASAGSGDNGEAHKVMAAENPADQISEAALEEEGDKAAEAEATEASEAKPRRRTRRKPAADKSSSKRAKSAPEAEPVAFAKEDDAADEDGDDAGENGGDNGGSGGDEDEQIESVGQEDALEEVPQRFKPRRQYKIQEVVKRRQIMLVQVVKEERGNKGAALTTYLSLAGRYCVLMPNTARGGGISRKITNANDRKRLKAIAGDLDVPQGMGVILRTAGAARTKAEVKRDFEYLLRLWENVRSLTLSSSAPCLVYEEGSLIKRSIRDLYDKDTGEILVQGEEGYREAKDFMRMLMPSHARNVKPHLEDQAIFSRFGVEAQLDRLLTPQVTLKSGGYLVINQTEALVSIDVNSGRSTREHSIEDTALQTNLEAAEEVARQLRLRDLAGLIVIDFIDMEEKRNNRAVEKRLKDALKNDRARIQVGRISHFGLLEMSRQRIRASVMESTMEVCPHCSGLGHVRSHASIALHVFRAIEDHVSRHSRHDVVAKCPPDIALDILNHKRSGLLDLEHRYGVRISIEGDGSLPGQSFNIEKGEPATGAPAGPRPASPGYVEFEDDEDIAIEESLEEEDQAEARDEPENGSDDGDRGRKRRRRRRQRGRRGGEDEREESGTEAASDEAESDAIDSEDEEEDSGGERRKRRRGKRGGRRNRRMAEAESGKDVASDSDEAEDKNEEAVGEDSPLIEEEAGENAEESAEQIEAVEETAEEEVVAEEPVQDEMQADETAESSSRRRTTRRPRGTATQNLAEPAEALSGPEASGESELEEGGRKRSGWWSRGGGFF
ncbi:MAG: Rne/Rng family ribonuclease [Salaquimonas sp.]|nr:Rne/Rng family ribonuclease [Salaquimonas sp.]